MVLIKIVRANITEPQIDQFNPKKGIDVYFKPYDLRNNIYDVMLATSSLNFEERERNYREDIERELEKLKIVSDRVRNNPFFSKTFDRKLEMTFWQHYNSKYLDSLDKFRSLAVKTTQKQELEKKNPYLRVVDY